MKVTLQIILLLILSHHGFAQLQEQTTQDAAEQSAMINEEVTDDVNPVELENLQRRKVNLNSDEYDDLLRLQLMNISQAEALTNHKIKNGNLIALQELQVIPEFNLSDINKLLPFISVISTLNPLEGRRELLIRNRKSLSGNKGNWFDRSGSLIKCRYDINQNISFGLLGEKDADELFDFSSKKYGLDHFSGYFQYRGSGIVRKVIAGDFRVQNGQGLMAWTGGAFGAASITGIFRAGLGISPSVTTDENNYLRGVALSLGKGQWTHDVFFSYHKRDCKIYEDTLSKEYYFTSFLSSGLHRSTNEIETKKTLVDRLAGTALSYASQELKIGLVICNRGFSVSKRPNGEIYDRFDLEGKSINNIGLNYRYNLKNIIFFGETAMDDRQNLSSTNGCIIAATKKTTIALLHRTFSIYYVPVYSNPFGAGTSANNERGIYLGFTGQLTRSLMSTTSLDSYKFPFLRYRKDKPSEGIDFVQQFDYNPGKKLAIQIRYREKRNDINLSDELNEIQMSDRKYRSLRFSSRFTVDDTWDYGTRVDYLITETNQLINQGMAVSADLFYHPKLSKIKWNFRYAVFYCPDFNARIYQYENDLPGSFSIPFYYGKGNRSYINLQYSMSRSTLLSIRYSVTSYNSGGRMADLKFQIRFKL